MLIEAFDSGNEEWSSISPTVLTDFSGHALLNLQFKIMPTNISLPECG